MSKKPRRILFLDDDSERASTFLEANPGAVWVQTVPECVEKLTELWDEVHLDHDLGGEHYVDVKRADCGMEVVRWLALEPRRHLDQTRFTVHSHNMVAALEMVLEIRSLGFAVEARPFGLEPPEVEPGPISGPWKHWNRALAMVRRFRGLRPPTDPGPIDTDPPDFVP